MTKDSIKLIIALGVVGIAAYFLFFKKEEEKKKDEDKKASNEEQPKYESSNIVFPFNRIISYGKDLITKFISEDEETAEAASEEIDETGISEEKFPKNYPPEENIGPDDSIPYANFEVVITSLANLVVQALEDYKKYAEAKKWMNRWAYNMVDEKEYYMTVVNIITHAVLETGVNRFREKINTNGNNLFNITGSTSYSKCPYIQDIYGHKYLKSMRRQDGNIKQEFRVYEKVIDSIIDYLDLINRATRKNPNTGKIEPRYGIWIYSYAYYDSEYIYWIGQSGYYTANAKTIALTCDNLRERIINCFDAETQKLLRSCPKHKVLTYKK